MGLLNQIQSSRQSQRKGLAILLDPDKFESKSIDQIVHYQDIADFFLLGGSLMTRNSVAAVCSKIRSVSTLPVVLFPGNIFQVIPDADAILFLSLISGRNPDLLIGQHVHAAPILRESGLEVIPTGYMLVESGKLTSAHYMSGTMPIPADKPDIAACTAMAGELLGLKLIYLDAGSGATKPVSSETVAAVKNAVDLPVVVGGGIRSPEDAERILDAGADYIVIGNALEREGGEALIAEIRPVLRKYPANVSG